MRLIADLASGQLSLVDPADTKRFDVLVGAEGPSERVLVQLDDLLRGADVGRLDRQASNESAAIIVPLALRRLAAPQVEEGWEDGFEAMLAYAATKGWIADDGGIRAHLSWTPANGEPM